MVNDDPGAAVRRAVDAISDRSIGDRVAELLAPSFVRHDLAGLVSGSHGPEGASGVVTMITAAMPDFRPGIEDISGAGDRATVRLPMSGTAQPRRCPEPAAARQPARRSSTALPGAAWPRAWQIVDGLALPPRRPDRPAEPRDARSR
jgi:SnoaL-like polyketide cyclase